MADEYERFKRFEYRENSNLVLQREGPGPNQNEPTGEPESLVGRLKHRMGDKISRERPKELEERLEKKRKRDEQKAKQAFTKKKTKLDITKGETVLSADVTETMIYRPTTRQTKAVYEQLLAKIQQQLGDQPQDVLRGAADEVLAALKTDNIRDVERKKNCEEVMGKLDEDTFTALYQMSKQVTDFHAEGEDVAMEESALSKSQLNDPTGVAVVFDEEDEAMKEAEDADFDEIDEEEEGDEDDEALGEETERRHLEARINEDEEDVIKEGDKYSLDVSKIDSHWLQRELGKFYTDPNVIVATEKEILSILSTPDLQECENKLVFILKYENFDFAKLILKNRWKLLYCTRLGQAQSNDEKAAIHEEMRATPEGQEVLEQLERVNLRRNKEEEFRRNVRKEAAKLGEKAGQAARQADEGEGIGGALAAVDAGDMKKPTHVVDLDTIAFAQGGHFMANKRCKLPEGSFRLEKKSYDEVHVKQYKPPEIDESTLVPISTLPEWAQAPFQKFDVKSLNPVQSRVSDCAFQQYDQNMLVCAPTGSGKTNVAMLTMLNVIGNYRLSDGSIDLNNFKIIYISPMKALVAEQVQSFSSRLACYGITVRELTGDVSLTRAQIDETQVIVCTPEKWDIITRKAGDRTYTQLVRLIIIDEVHLLHDSRGPVLESIVARTIRQIETSQERIRLVGLSATLPNYEDVAVFMRVDIKKGLYHFGAHYRPVPLEQEYIGVKEKKAIKRFNTMNEVTYEKVMEKAGKKQVLVFVHSRKETAKTARAIRDLAMQNDTLARFLQDSPASREVLQAEAEDMQTPEIKELLPYGFGIHHAGLSRKDRKLIEDLFYDRHIQVLVSTSTLAWGVNLPAHTVIIKGTQVYMPEKGAWSELSPMDIMQMMGRAGRPQFDKEGHGIIITNQSELQYYLSLNNQQLPIESQLISLLPDILNAEIVLGTIQSRADAVNWLGYTYLYVRMYRNPPLYGFTEEEKQEDDLLLQRRTDLVHSALMLLDKHQLIKYDKRTGNVASTTLGQVASHYYIKHPTIAAFNEHLKPSMSDIELLRLFSLSNEFKYIPVREEEKVELLKLVERVPVPVKGSMEEKTASSKVNVLLQAYISKLKLEGFALMADMVYVQQNAGRIMRAIYEICLKRGWAALAHRALSFCKMIDKRMWASMTPMRQFNLEEPILRKMEKKDFSWERYYDLSSTEIGELLRLPNLGKKIHRFIHQFPKLDLSAYVQPITRSCLLVELTITPDFQWDPKIHGTAEPFWIFVEDVDGETILHHEIFLLTQRGVEEEHTVNFTVPVMDPLPPQYFIRVVSDRWLHAESLLPVSFKSLILPEKNPPHTELLDLQPLPVTALRFPEAEALYSSSIKFFNPIQTQVFSSLYSSGDNVLICASPAAGKIICAEFAILRMLKGDGLKRCVYMAPYELTARERFAEWSAKFGKLGLRVNEPTGDLNTDLKILEQSHIFITTPDKWDLISRRWRSKKVATQLRLFIADELQLLDSEVGPTMEVCVSRMRYISAQTNQSIRILGLACSLSNAKDVAEWIGAGSTNLFNFGPNIRTVPLEIAIYGFDMYYRGSRLLAMGKTVYQAIKTKSPDKPVIIFVADRKQCRLTAIDLLLQAAADDKPKRFLHVPDDVMANQIKGAREKALKQTLEFGVGFYHEGFSESERGMIERLFESGAIQVLVTTEQLTWGMTMSAHLVIVMDTKKFDGRENRWVDYPVSDIIQMMGRATRPHIDKSGVFCLLCHSSKKEYYKKFIYEPLPVESHLDQKERMADFINAEVVLKTIDNKQDAIDWLTWTFYYRRISKNPNYYGLQGVTHGHISDHLSELVETTVEALEQSQCLSVEEEVDLSALNLGLIAAFYYIRYTTIEKFNRALRASTKRKAMIEIICAATEYDYVPVRAGEEAVLKGLASQLGVRLSDREKINEPHIKAQILLYAHFNRTAISTDLQADQRYVLDHAVRLTQGMVDVLSSNGWLQPALVAMEICQMTVQAMTTAQSPLLQLPHFDETLISKAKEMEVADVFDLLNMEDDQRTTLLQPLSQTQVADVAKACNRYPMVTMEHEVISPDDIAEGDAVQMNIKFERDLQDEALGPVFAPFYPKEKDEQWWVIAGRAPKTKAAAAEGGEESNLAFIKRISIAKSEQTVKLEFEAPGTSGEYDYVLYLMCDSYVGCDQEYRFNIHVKPGGPADDE